MDTIIATAVADTAPSGPISQQLAAFTSWRVVVAAFLRAGVDSENTRRAYYRHLLRAFTELGVDSLADVNGAMLAAYRARVTSSGLAPASQAQALAALRAFLRWAGSMGAHQLPTDVIRAALRTPRATVQRPYAVLSEPEIAAMLAAAQTPRDTALLAVLFGAGLRVAEASALDVADVQEDGDGGTVMHVRQGIESRCAPQVREAFLVSPRL